VPTKIVVKEEVSSMAYMTFCNRDEYQQYWLDTKTGSIIWNIPDQEHVSD